jgi:hypothetical protein
MELAGLEPATSWVRFRRAASGNPLQKWVSGQSIGAEPLGYPSLTRGRFYDEAAVYDQTVTRGLPEEAAVRAGTRARRRNARAKQVIAGRASGHLGAAAGIEPGRARGGRRPLMSPEQQVEILRLDKLGYPSPRSRRSSSKTREKRTAFCASSRDDVRPRPAPGGSGLARIPPTRPCPLATL